MASKDLRSHTRAQHPARAKSAVEQVRIRRIRYFSVFKIRGDLVCNRVPVRLDQAYGHVRHAVHKIDDWRPINEQDTPGSGKIEECFGSALEEELNKCRPWKDDPRLGQLS